MAGSYAALNREVFDNPKKYEGRIARKGGSKKLYLDFFYHGIRIERSTGMDDTPLNRAKVEKLLAAILEQKKLGTLEFAKLFPGASEEEKAFHTRLEHREYAPDARGITFGDYVTRWYGTIWPNFPSHTKREDYRSAIDYWLLPYFGQKSFFHITGIEMQKFLATLKHRAGPKVGEPLSRARVVNVLQVFKTIWNDAVEEHRWTLTDPCRSLKKHLPKKRKKVVEVFRFHEWGAIIEAMELYYRPVAKLMVLTGMIASELAALKKTHIRDGFLYVEQSIVRGEESDSLKTEYRQRRIPLTRAITGILEQATTIATGEYLFTMENGATFTAEKFQRRVWTRALAKAGVKYRKPYTTRHTFAAWALAIRTDQNRVVNLMGHASKQMIYEVYGRYVEGLEKDRLKILAYFGRDFKRGS
ncbi:tyrosine-type recombinase/integrase [Geobacter pickeringii]|uniref:tyrosine-type recombinase/integrase n=1 Tax=Geobacter pickeringii TaxID=345632 RepID=UPI00068CFAB4|nr:tyrosine-type recombinase/integrase [Geobacter pickeringii]